ncbi:MAG TPA: response regulator [Opitutus sp.]|nr:response regulator [Opitutus sp.]
MKILHLEDNQTDAALVRELLQGEWPDCAITAVSDRAAYQAALARESYDLILSDFMLVGFNGNDALELARAATPHTPFMFLSGNIGEDRAIEAVHAGAVDYVLKDRMKRLVTAIRRALQHSAERARHAAIEAERERLSAVLETTPDFVGMATPDGRVFYLNHAARATLGLDPGPLPDNFTIADYRPPEFAAAARGHLAAAIRDGSWTGETVLLDRAGRLVPVSQVILSHRGPDDTGVYTSTVMRDLTPRKQTEALVNGQNQILEMLAGGEPLGETLDALLNFLETQAEDIICSVLRLEDDGRRLRHASAPHLPAAYSQAIDGVEIGPATGSCGTAAHRRAPVMVADITTDPLWDDYRHLALPHGLRACWSTPIFDVNHHLLGTLAVYRRTPGEPDEHHRRLIDVGTHIAAICLSRHETERKLRDQAEILHKASDAIIVTDLANRVTFWNHSAERTFGWTAAEVIGRDKLQLFPAFEAGELESIRDSAQANQEWRGELRLQNREGKTLIMDSRITVILDEQGRPIGRLTIATDVTARKGMEEQFFRAQRLESIGMLAAGIAHDLNNILAPILLAAPMLRDRVTDPSDLQMLGTLEKSAERGAALIRQILGFAHGAGGEHRVVQVRHIMRDVAAFIRETFPKSIEFRDHVPNDLWTVKANPTQLHQVLLNLCVNARDAMPGGGTLTLRAENRVLDEFSASHIEGARPGPFLLVTVTDTGTGIDPAALAHIWEPFFTTKGAGKGTGLGLSTVRGIVEGHAGFISLQTIVGEGSAFGVYLPATPEALEKTVASPGVSLVPRGHGELVLVADDEVSIRNMCAAMLSRHGYRVLTASDGTEAIALFAPRSTEIRLVVTDISMPNLDGPTLASIVGRLNPAVKILAISGHNADSRGQPPAKDVSHAFLVKPFRPEMLLATVHKLLHAEDADAEKN